ncbi:transcriptional regulator IclR family [Vibrio variabilis]|uniref:HTH-type transcriptional repressor AllR n=1 Tax=Vibrio variabilis TaxID=990271 RepID=A0ABQ0JQB4_9VIBR|nr:transcriptional regulator IclR family [Vibrio variabilis]
MDKAKNNLALIKALDVVEAVANGDRYLKDICSRLDIPKSTVHRILLGLIKANYIHEIKDVGLVLGTKLIQLGHIAEDNLPIKQIANPFLRHLAAMTKDTVHLGIRERDSIYFLDSVSGERHVQMSSRQGTCSPLSLSITGKSLMLDMEREEWLRIAQTQVAPQTNSITSEMEEYQHHGYSYGHVGYEKIYYCISVPVRDDQSNIVAAISVTTLKEYMPEDRVNMLVKLIQQSCDAIAEQIKKAQQIDLYHINNL